MDDSVNKERESESWSSMNKDLNRVATKARLLYSIEQDYSLINAIKWERERERAEQIKELYYSVYMMEECLDDDKVYIYIYTCVYLLIKGTFFIVSIPQTHCRP